ncbi:MAG: MotA/TolQ/ExbB proton channel family protein [Kiritimatiellia bacterium]|jgi:biopolymer transport protein ExbB|nr:MotA/TolQ/ExbB proton channel family protein [Kiritimatiellia bacterium]MDP6809562.1 MotA/TolQ/ExbB proton channel family protein [Kiritimatiellia bacterium]MDP7023587.1 MotA/TolQ/ExbB proton channel family protein [Kiritimatiellia bacterium]
MKMVLKLTLVLALVFVMSCACNSQAQEEAARGDLVTADGTAAAAPTNKGSGGFFSVIIASGPLGVMLWLALFGAAGAAVYFSVDCAITVRAKRIMPQELIESVTESMAEGDVLKALQNCESEPGPMANILSAGFSHVEEGYDVIQESISTAADLETEQIMQKLTWLSVVGNLAPMLGLLGTVQGMIAAFSTLAEGAPDVGVLAMNISQALFTTAGGLTIAVPCVAVYYTFRNIASKIILQMEAMTIELIKDLRNVEVVEE